MEVNKLYKGMYGGLVVKCTTASNGGSFGGVVVDSGRSKHSVGFDCSRWACDSFEEYNPAQVLTNGHAYNIPDGCKATITDGVITIESNVRYYKQDNITYKIYARIEGSKMVKIAIDDDGSKDIYFRDDCEDVEYSETCTEEEFMKVYNDVIKIGL